MFDLKFNVKTEHVFWLLLGYLLARLFSKEGKTPSEAAALDTMFSGDEFNDLMNEADELEIDFRRYQDDKRVAKLGKQGA